MVNLGKLKEITDLRSVWPHEALNFTPWVADRSICNFFVSEQGSFLRGVHLNTPLNTPKGVIVRIVSKSPFQRRDTDILHRACKA
jgi:hypothetical protein